ncbi:AraC family transcriptional regulator [Paenibacillus sp. F6_3S_P_1C]|uniref:AraC family transcriptional regulator n=2 Tax=Paenibacillus vandeheii TaxID=3035917 RepID=A0ABT8J8W7_9BACL|nr:AraC family transcriptional regulator [Paenibacillus vandeheii]
MFQDFYNSGSYTNEQTFMRSLMIKRNFQIAEKYHFSSVHYFSRLFHQLTGQAPRQYRLQQSKTVALGAPLE